MKALGKKALLWMFAFKLSVKQCKRKLKYVIYWRGKNNIVDSLVYCDQIHLLYFPHLEAQQWHHRWFLQKKYQRGYAFLVLTFHSFLLPGYWHFLSKKIYIKAIHSTNPFNLWKLHVCVILLYLVLLNYIKAHYWLIPSYLHFTVCCINYDTMLIKYKMLILKPLKWW